MSDIKVYTHSLGCPKNMVDSENLLGGLGDIWSPAATPSEADVVLINTCAFIRPAVEESLESIFHAAHEIQDLDPKPLLVVTGCLVSRYGSELKREIPEADLCVPVQGQQGLPEQILARLGRMPRPASGVARPGPRNGFAYLKISEGCNNRCAFCTIPYIRGRLRSRPIPDLVEEASYLLSHGIQELVLVAQDTTAYGRDLKDGSDLSLLVKELSKLSGLKWLRVMYMYPSGLNKRLLGSLAEVSPPFVPYFDVPLQHAHPDILRKMGRPFNHDPMRVLKRIREFFPHAAIRTTLITGYPGEKEKHFRALLEFVRRARVQHLGVFSYYPEEGTRAAGFSGQLARRIKDKRRQVIMQEQRFISRQYLQGHVGLDMDVLVEGPHPEWPGLYTGRTWFQAPEVDGMTYISGPSVKTGELVRAEIRDSLEYDLEALA